MELVTANQYTFEELTEAYNQTRVDYLVPMPMNVARLREYVQTYDIALEHSFVARDKDLLFGLGMLGVRPQRTWVTRLGVLPSGRRQGTGQALMDAMLGRTAELGIQTVWLEVIKGNKPAHTLFCKCGFVETRELIVARRPPTSQDEAVFKQRIKQVTPHDHEQALALLAQRRERPNWLNETESLQNVRNLSVLEIKLHDGGQGWVVYHASLFQLTRIVVGVTSGDPAEVTAVTLQVLHQRHKQQDAIAENIPADDPKWPGYEQAGYFDAFRRIEMVRV